ncbi:MAG: amidohydrolase family protein, partial [Acidobacteriota bacterium]|nr:amidohydrolase family protein [Acidobacteriota bacterium]
MSQFSRRQFFGSSAVMPFGLGLPTAVAAQVGGGTVRADMIVTGGRILTMDPDQPVAEAMAIRGDRILAVGAAGDIEGLVGSQTTRLDVRGLTITPGFIDAHSHPLFAEEAVGVNVNLRSIADVKNALARKAAETPPGQWVRGVMYDDTKFDEGRALNRYDIDEAVRDHPVYVGHRGGHTGVVNSAALRLAGVTNDTPDPVGGRFFRENGQLTGKVAEYARDVFFTVGTWPVVDRGVRQRAATISSRNMAAVGLTSTTDAFGSLESLVAYQDARETDELFFRLSFMPGGNSEVYQGLKLAGIRSGFGDDILRIGAVKFSADGSASERTMYMSTPFEGTDDHGILTMSQEEINAAVDEAVAHGFRVGIHANGDVT